MPSAAAGSHAARPGRVAVVRQRLSAGVLAGMTVAAGATHAQSPAGPTSPPPAAPAGPPSAPAGGADRLTGDWGGSRERLARHGMTLQLEATAYLQALLSGAGPTNAEPGARVDGLVNVDLSKLGLWKGAGVRTHLETALGHPGLPGWRAMRSSAAGALTASRTLPSWRPPVDWSRPW